MVENVEFHSNEYFEKIDKENNILLIEQKKDIESKFSDQVQDDLFGIEDSSWWFSYRAEIVYQMAEKFFNRKNYIFDLGGVMDILRTICKIKDFKWHY